MSITKEDMGKAAENMVILALKYKNNSVFREAIDNGTIDYKQEFGVDVGDAEIVVKANSQDTIYIVIEENKNQALNESTEFSTIAGAKYEDHTFDSAVNTISFLGVFTGLGFFAIPFGAALAGYTAQVQQSHPEYFHEGTGVIKSQEEYYGS